MKKLLIFTNLAIALSVLSACALPTPPGAAAPTAAAINEATPAPTNQIIADAVVVPQRYVDLSFEVTGRVAEVLVKEGDTVAAGAPLARLDTRDLELQIAQSKASIAQAQAAYDKIAAGATPEQIAAAQALVNNAEANLQRTRQGNTTAADIAAAQAQLRQAQAALAIIRNPSAGDVSAAKARVDQATVALQATRDSSSQAKTSAELAFQQAVDGLTQAQAAYAKAKGDNEYAQSTGNNPAQPEVTDAKGNKTDNKLSDSQRAQYATALVQAEAQLRSAEGSVTSTQVAFDQTRKSEVSAIATAESQLAAAQAQFAAVQNPDKNRIAQLQASVDQARANVQKMQQGGSQADLAAAQAVVSQQQANLAGLTTPPRSVDLAEAKSRIDAAQVALQQAERNLEKATLHAPFAGTIAERNLEVGQPGGNATSASTAPFVLADNGTWLIETSNLGERDVVRVKRGSSAELSFDALPGVKLAGNVTAIRPRGVDSFGNKTYTVTITPNTPDERLRWNMTSSVAIAPAP